MKILNNLTFRHLKLNKKRTIVTIIGIILSTALMVGIGLLFSTLRDASIKSIIKYEGDYFVKFESINSDDYNLITNNVNVSSYYYNSSLGYVSSEKVALYLKVIGANEKFLNSVTLKSGRLPQNGDEVLTESNLSSNKLFYEIDGNNKIQIDVADSIDNMENTIKKTYTVVGVIDQNESLSIQYGDASYGLITIGHSDNYDLYVKYKNPKDTYKITEEISKNLSNKEISYNSSLLALYGISNYQNVMNTLTTFMVVILAIVAIGCILVIYNSFAISVMERKKQFGLFSSIGATKKQLRYTVFFEALIVGLIGIPLGILSGILGIWVVLIIINNLIGSALMIDLSLCIYPLFILIPVLFMIITVFLSALIPSMRASRSTPINAIRQSDDIKIKTKEVKTSKLISKIFGVEGEISSKNMKRSRKKYRITVISLVVSIVLFITFSYILEYGLQGSYDYLEMPDYNIMVTYSRDKDKEKTYNIAEQIRNNFDVKKSTLVLDNAYLTSKRIDISNYTKEYKDVKNITSENNISSMINIINLSQSDYEKVKKENNLVEDKPIIINYYSIMSYKDGGRKSFSGKMLNDDFNESINICDNYISEDGKMKDDSTCNSYIINDYYIIDNEPFGLNMIGTSTINIIVPNDMYNEIVLKANYSLPGVDINEYGFTLVIDAPTYKNITKLLEELQSENQNINFINIQEEMKMMYNIILVIKILLYGFIALVTLIGITSVFNTINTNINLRRKEFAMLRSVGLTTKGFNKILCLESFFLGVKSLLFAIPISLFNCFMLNKIGNGSVDVDFAIPYMSILIAIIAVFIIVLITMLYSTRKIKHENILEAIREENI